MRFLEVRREGGGPAAEPRASSGVKAGRRNGSRRSPQSWIARARAVAPLSRLALDQDRQGGPCGALRQPADPLPLGAGGGFLGLAAKGTDVVGKEPW